MEVLFIYGPAAAGKHTIGSQVSSALGWPLFHNHLVVDVALTLFEFGSDGFKQLRADLWQSAFAAAAQHQQSFVFTFNPEATVAVDLIEKLEASITGQGGHMHYIELQCSDETVLERLNNPSRQAFGKLTDVDLYQQIKQSGGFDFPRFCQPELVIDTTATSASAAASQIIGELGLG